MHSHSDAGDLIFLDDQADKCDDRSSRGSRAILAPMRRLLAAVLLAVVLPAPSGFAADQPLPKLEDLCADFAYKQVRMSPDGRYLAAIVPIEGRDGLAVVDWSTRKLAGAMRFSGDEIVLSYQWLKDGRLLIENGETNGWRDTPVSYGELFVANADGSEFKAIYGYRAGEQQIGSHVRKGTATFGWGALVSSLPDDPNDILIASYPWSGSSESSWPTVYRLDLRTGVLRKILGAPIAHAEFLATRDGDVRFATGIDRNDVLRIFEFVADTEEWRPIALNSVEGFQFLPQGITSDGRMAYYLSDKEGKQLALYALDLQTREEKLLFRHESASVDSVYLDPHTGEALWVVLGADRSIAYLRPEHPISQVHRLLGKSFRDHMISIVDVTRDYGKSLVSVKSDRDPGRWYLVDAPTKHAELVAAASERIDTKQMLPVRTVSLAARDGLELQAYYTRPHVTEEKPPMVVLVHGGPHARDAWEFNPEVQILASRGYAVLQVNYRGSTGHGRAFEMAGRGEWGRKMQDDLTDATRWAIAQGLADPQRVCIMGTSYGGYASLMGVVREPDLYRCAIDIAGVSDLDTLFTEGDIQDSLSGKSYLRSAIGNDASQWQERSPARQAEAIRAPVLIIHGGKDRRVPIKHAKLMEKALKQAGKTVETMYVNSEGHGFFKPEHRVQQYQRVLEFLARQIPVRN